MEVVTTIVGAALGAAFQQLFDSVLKANRKATMFDSVFKDLDLTLRSYQELVKDIEQVENFQPLPGLLDGLKTKMEEGSQLVDKCSNIHPLLKIKKKTYVGKLRALDESLQRLFFILKWQVDINLGNRVSNLQRSVDRIDRNVAVQNRTENQIRGWCVVPNPPSFTVGLDKPLKDLKMKFLNDDQVSMLVLTAPGGCGKTTLAQMFCRDEEVKDKFKSNVFFVTVSMKPNLSQIVQELYHGTGARAPDFQNDATAVSWLQQFLKQTGQNPMLLVLDDVWAGSEFILEKFYELKMTNYKILVTSRSAFPRFGSPYYVECLNDEDAMALFHHAASLGDRSSYISEDLPRKIVERCIGFPLAITVVGRSLCGQPIAIWQKRVLEWSRGSSVLESEHDLLDCLQRSLDALDEEKSLIRECFIDLGLFPEDKRISATLLIDMWAELYGINEDISSIVNLYELASRSLVNLVLTRNDKDGNGYYTEHFVTQHDMLRELAIQQISREPLQLRMRLMIDVSGDNFPMWWKEQKYQSLIARLVSISTGCYISSLANNSHEHICTCNAHPLKSQQYSAHVIYFRLTSYTVIIADEEFSSKWQNLPLPEAEVLILNFQTKYYALPEFVEEMNKLKTLVLTSSGIGPAELNNFQLVDSKPNLKRIRLERISFPSISRYPIQLKSLKKISLFMCRVGQGFGNGSIHISEAFPNLVEMNIDYCNDLVELPADLCDLIQLKKLSVTSSHKLSVLPEDIGNLVNLELLRLRCCTDLSELPGSIRNLKNLILLDISDCFSIKELPEDIGELCSLERFNMRHCSRLNELPSSVVNLKQLKEVTCDEETEILWEPFLPYLRNIHIKVVKEDINLNWLH